jgi:hypothetical protein
LIFFSSSGASASKTAGGPQLVMKNRPEPQKATPPRMCDHTHVPYATPSEDNYSSEEELKEIINEKRHHKDHQQKNGSKKKAPSKKEKKIAGMIIISSKGLGSVAGPVIQATGRSEFEDGLGSGDFVSGFSYHMSVRTRLSDHTKQTKFQSQRPNDVETPVPSILSTEVQQHQDSQYLDG